MIIEKNTKNLNFQLFSDIHSELWGCVPEMKPKSDYLFLAGNICQFKRQNFMPIIDFCSKNWKKTFYVPGNHEFWSPNYMCKSFEEYEFEYKYFIEQKYKNVFFLNDQESHIENNLYVYGTTLWTRPTNITRKEMLSEGNIDYNSIYFRCHEKNYNIPITTKYMQDLSDLQYNKLIKYINENSSNLSKKIIIMTHFPPTQNNTMMPSEVKSCFADNINAWDNILDNLYLDNIPLWISGHTHYSYNFLYKNKIRLLSNQMGFKNEFGETRFSELGLFKLKY
jgi:predicted MPP superfamily phosphohydrolase